MGTIFTPYNELWFGALKIMIASSWISCTWNAKSFCTCRSNGNGTEFRVWVHTQGTKGAQQMHHTCDVNWWDLQAQNVCAMELGIPFWSSNDCALLCELLLHLTQLWNLLLDKALISWIVCNLGFQGEVLVKVGWAPAPLFMYMLLKLGIEKLTIGSSDNTQAISVSFSTLLYDCAATQLQISSSLVIFKQQAMDWLASCIQPWEALENWPQLFSHCSFAGEEAREWAPEAGGGTYHHFELSQHHNNHHHNNPVIPILLGPNLNPATVQEDFIPAPTAPAAAARGRRRSPHKFTR